jgi:hypothetical protein
MAIDYSADIADTVAESGHNIQLNRSVFVTNKMGGRIYSNTPVGEVKTCWFQQATQDDIETWGQRNINLTHKCYFSSDPGAKQGDVCQAGGLVPSFLSGNKLVVTGFDDQGGLGQLVVLLLNEVKDGNPG